MFGKADDPTLLFQAAYKRDIDKKFRVNKRFEEGYMAFLDRPKHEPKTGKESDEKIVKSKLLPKLTGWFPVIRAYPDAVVVDQGGAELTVSVEICSKAPTEN